MRRRARPVFTFSDQEEALVIESLEIMELGNDDMLLIKCKPGADIEAGAGEVAQAIKDLRPDWAGNVLVIPNDIHGMQVLGWLYKLKMEDINSVLKKIDEAFEKYG